VFFMAVDGVAPRAKINQQRARRFRSAMELKDAREKLAKSNSGNRGEGRSPEELFDSNCITPGTEFMEQLDAALHYFIARKVTEDANWRKPQIIYSGSQVPGEGEHKIMVLIRLSKADKAYTPNTRHCLYGLDADLILLGLLSHESHFALLREEVSFGKNAKRCIFN
jgi:5'-3' exoribonuclease 1